MIIKRFVLYHESDSKKVEVTYTTQVEMHVERGRRNSNGAGEWEKEQCEDFPG